MKTTCCLVCLMLVTGTALAQTNEMAATNVTTGAALRPATNVSPLVWTATGMTIRAQGAGLQPLAPGGTLTIPQGGGRSTRISSTPGGMLTIHEPGNNNLTTVIPSAGGGLTIRGSDNESIYISPMPDGSVRMSGARRNDRTRAVVSPDGKSVTIWTGGGAYTVPIPQK